MCREEDSLFLQFYGLKKAEANKLKEIGVGLSESALKKVVLESIDNAPNERFRKLLEAKGGKDEFRKEILDPDVLTLFDLKK